MGFYSNSNVEAQPIGIDLTTIMRQVYLWMTLGLAVSAVTAFGLAQSGAAIYFYRNPILMLVTILAYIFLAFTLQPLLMHPHPSSRPTLYLPLPTLFRVIPT